MRFTTVARKLLGVITLFVTGGRFHNGALVLAVRPRWRKPRCGRCGRRAPGYDTRPPRTWKALPVGRVPVLLEYAPRRVLCPRCKSVRTEQVPWAEHNSRFTRDFEELAAYLAKVTDRTTASAQLGVCWQTVGRIVDRVVQQRLDDSRLDKLYRIGIDEFGYRKRHRYLTVVVDHDRRRVIWAAKGKSSDTLADFFKQLGPERLAQLETATIDMAGSYIKALRQHAPNVEVVFDCPASIRNPHQRQLEFPIQANQLKKVNPRIRHQPTPSVGGTSFVAGLRVAAAGALEPLAQPLDGPVAATEALLLLLEPVVDGSRPQPLAHLPCDGLRPVLDGRDLLGRLLGRAEFGHSDLELLQLRQGRHRTCKQLRLLEGFPEATLRVGAHLEQPSHLPAALALAVKSDQLLKAVHIRTPVAHGGLLVMDE